MHEDDQRDGRAVAEGEALEAELVHVGRHRLAGVDRSAFGHDPDQVEELERAQRRKEDRQPDRRAKERDRHVADDARGRGAVDQRRLLQLARDVLQTGQVEDEVEAEELPGDHDEDARSRTVSGSPSQPRGSIAGNDRAEQAVDARTAG